MRFGFFLISAAIGAAPRDPCTQLCNRDGPAVCTGGSWTKDNGSCQAYLFRGDPAIGDYCYHTAATAATCPARGQAVRAADVAGLLARGGAGAGPVPTTTRPPTTTTTTTTTTTRRPTTTIRPPLTVVAPTRAPVVLLRGTPPPIMPGGAVGEVDDRLAAFLGSFLLTEVEEICALLPELELYVAGAISPANVALGPAAYWLRAGGPQLLRLAALQSTCRNALMVHVGNLLTRLPAVLPDGFMQSSGLAQFFTFNGPQLRAWLLSGSLPDFFSATLRRLMPELLEGREGRFESLYAEVRRLALASPQRSLGYVAVRRASAFTDSGGLLSGWPQALLTGFPQIQFVGEAGADAGGLGRDWYSTVARLVFSSDSTDPNGGLFRMKAGTDYLQLEVSKPLSGMTRPYYQAVGRLLAMAVAQRRPLGVPLSRMFFRRLLGEPLTMADVALDDPETHRNLVITQGMDEATLRVVIGLDDAEPCPTAAEHVAATLQGLVSTEEELRIAAIREGLTSVLPVETIRSLVTPDDMRSLVFGAPEISVDDLIAHTQYDGRIFRADSPQIGWLWAWLRRSDNSVRRKFLRFVTGLSQLPLNGMAGIGGRLYIRGPIAADLAPRSHTCSFALDMPVYRSAAELEEWMGAAVSSDGFGMA